MIYQFDTAQLHRGSEHLWLLGARATAEFLAEFASANACLQDLLDRLGQYRRLTPDQLRATGGDRFPTRALVAVPKC